MRKLWIKKPCDRKGYSFWETEVSDDEHCLREDDFKNSVCFVPEARYRELELEQVRHIEIIEEANSKLVYELEAKNGELETKLQQAQAVYNSLIDGAARDTERINDLTEKLNYVKHLHSTSWDHQQVEIKELNAKNTGLEKKLEIAVEAFNKIDKSNACMKYFNNDIHEIIYETREALAAIKDN